MGLTISTEWCSGCSKPVSLRMMKLTQEVDPEPRRASSCLQPSMPMWDAKSCVLVQSSPATQSEGGD